MSEQAQAINEYVCQKCGGITRTVNRDDGTTPFMMKCRAHPANVCDGEARSSFYRVSQNKLPSWEWIKPAPEEFEDWLKRHRQEKNRHMLADHVARGGLLLQKLDVCGLERYGFRLRHG
jgi:hypothetical protein